MRFFVRIRLDVHAGPRQGRELGAHVDCSLIQSDKINLIRGKKVDDANKTAIMHGADEKDLVHSGLEETMMEATREILAVWRSNPQIPDMRTAAYVNAINKVATSYQELGIFP